MSVFNPFGSTSGGPGGVLTEISVSETFTDSTPTNGPFNISIGSFKMPSDTVANSAALLYFSAWAMDWFTPASPNELMDYRVGFSAIEDSPVTSWYRPVAGFIVPPSNTSLVPSPILAGPHTPSTSTPGAPGNDYTQLPYYVVLNPVVANQTIYANVESAYAQNNINSAAISIAHLVYQKR